MRKYYWYLSAYLRKHGKIVALSVVLAIAIFSFTLPLIINRLEVKKHLYIGLVGVYNLESLPEEIEELISFGLTKLNKDGTVDPSLAERWVIEDDGKTYRFIIKKGLKWQDGQDFKPEDIDYQLTDTEIIATSNDVVFKLPDVFVPFPTFVTKPLLRFEEQSRWGIFTKKKILGLNKYEAIDYKLTGKRLQEITLESPEEKRTYRFYLTGEDAIQAFKMGQVDVLNDITDPQELLGWKNILASSSLQENKYLGLFLNNQNPKFNKNIRQAFSYAIKKPEGKSRAIGPISPQSWVYLPASKTYDYDLDRAIERLLSEVPETPLEFTLTSVPFLSEDAESIKTQLEDLGQKAFEQCQATSEIKDKARCANLQIKIDLRINTFPDLNDFEAMLIVRESPKDPDQYNLWHSDQEGNFINYKNTRIDSLLEKGRKVAAKEERKAIYQEFQQFLLEDAPVVFISHPLSYEIRRK